MNVQEAIEICNQFALKHKVIFEEQGEVGFGRPCVGFMRGNNYVDYRPYHSETCEPIWPENDAIRAPEATPNAYHKHDCLAVLVHGENYDAAKIELAEWVKHIEAQGEVEIASYATGAKGLQALITGVIGYGIRLKGKE